MNPFCLDLFSFFNAHYSQVWHLMVSMSSCKFISHLLSCLTNSSSAFSLISTLSSSSEILSSTLVLVCWSGFPLCFVFLFHSSEVFHIMGHFLFNVF
jgi:hypothetical protein